MLTEKQKKNLTSAAKKAFDAQENLITRFEQQETIYKATNRRLEVELCDAYKLINRVELLAERFLSESQSQLKETTAAFEMHGSENMEVLATDLKSLFKDVLYILKNNSLPKEAVK